MEKLPIASKDLFTVQQLSNPAILDEAQSIAAKLVEHGFEAYFVGGCVRDGLLNRRIKDIDIATNAKPEEIEKLFDKVEFVGASFGVTLVKQIEEAYEVATYRKDGSYSDSRRPDSIDFGTREEDSHRRDFTINALYYDPVNEIVVDDHGGLTDLKNYKLKTVGEPKFRFTEDALRILRAIRFVTRLNFTFDSKTYETMKELSSTVTKISAERIRDELTKILTGPFPSRGIRIIQDIGLLESILPEVAAMKGVPQGKRYHPEGEVLRHTLLGLEIETLGTEESRWGILLHDIGKKPTYSREKGKITFYQHEHVGADMSLELTQRLKFPKDEQKNISEVVRRHMKFMDARKWKKSTMRRFIAAPTIESDLSVHRADCEACHGMLHGWEHVKNNYASAEIAEEKDLPKPWVNGRDLIEHGYSPSPLFGVVLNETLDAQMNGDVDEESALNFALQLMKEKSGS